MRPPSRGTARPQSKATPKRSGTLVSRTVEDREAAVAWYRKAAEQGDAVAQHSLGDAYYD